MLRRELAIRVLELFAKYDSCHDLYWKSNLQVFIINNDLIPMVAVVEQIRSAKDIDRLKKFFVVDEINAPLLYCIWKTKIKPPQYIIDDLKPDTQKLINQLIKKRKKG